MKKIGALFMFLVVFSSFIVIAENNSSSDWDDFTDREIKNTSVVTAPTEKESTGSNSEDLEEGMGSMDFIESSGEEKYTEDFYLAFWISIGAIFLLILFLYLFFRRPHNEWKRKYS